MAALSAAETHEMLEVPAREDLVRRCAYELHEGNGCVDGRDLDDWRAAEAEISGLVAVDAASSQAGEARIRNPTETRCQPGVPRASRVAQVVRDDALARARCQGRAAAATPYRTSAATTTAVNPI